MRKLYPSGGGTVPQEIDRKAVFVGEEIGSAPVLVDHRSMMLTSHKFRIERDLSKTRIGDASSDPLLLQDEVPASLLPMRADELIVEERAGEMNVDGVSVIFCTNHSIFVERGHYLIFASLGSWQNGQRGRAGFIQNSASDAIFNMLTDVDHFQPAYPSNSPFQMELMKHYHGSIKRLAAVQANSRNQIRNR